MFRHEHLDKKDDKTKVVELKHDLKILVNYILKLENHISDLGKETK
jgi:hypothetical protein